MLSNVLVIYNGAGAMVKEKYVSLRTTKLKNCLTLATAKLTTKKQTH